MQNAQGRLYVLGRYHIENYLLDDEAIARTLIDVLWQDLSQEQGGVKLQKLATDMAGEVLRDMVAFSLNLLLRPEDFTLGQVFHGQRFW